LIADGRSIDGMIDLSVMRIYQYSIGMLDLFVLGRGGGGGGGGGTSLRNLIGVEL
jgi:hypothetical protein